MSNSTNWTLSNNIPKYANLSEKETFRKKNQTLEEMTQEDKDNYITDTKKDPQRICKEDGKRWGLDGVLKSPDRDPTADYRRAATYHDEGWAPIKAAGMHGVRVVTS